MGKEYGIGIVGCGMISAFHARAIADMSNARLVAIYSRSREKAEGFATKHGCTAYTDYDRFLKDTGVTTLDFAKAMIDEGFHPMTMYFPLVVHGALLMEPTETESRATLDQFAATLKELAARAKAGDVQSFKEAPRLTPRRRLDETAAARNPVLRWVTPADKEAAE